MTDRFFAGKEVQKWSPQGDPLWSRYFADRSTTSGDLQLAANGTVLIGSSIQGTVDFDPSAKVYAITSVNAAGYVLGLSSAGKLNSFVMFNATNGSGISSVSEIETDNSGNIYAAGFYSGNVDFDPSGRVLNLPNTGAFIAKLNGANSLVWAKSIQRTSGSGAVSVTGLMLDPLGSLFVLGNYSGTMTWTLIRTQEWRFVPIRSILICIF